MPNFGRLVRFRTSAGAIHFGEVEGKDRLTKESLVGRIVPIYEGNSPWDDDLKLTGKKEEIAEVLCPLPYTPIFECVGLNYKQHAAEANTPHGSFPVIFTKPPDALAGPFEDIPIHKECLLMDYEAELCVIIGRDCKNVSPTEDVFQYVLGYTAGNDVSSRYWQMPERSGNQHGGAKSFDKFAPIGPVISSSAVIPNPHALSLKAVVNGEVRQDANTDDLIFDIPAIIRHLSRGTTLRKGTVIMTGTPSGVAAFMKLPAWLKDGDVVEIEIEGIGQIRNKMVFEK